MNDSIENVTYSMKNKHLSTVQCNVANGVHIRVKLTGSCVYRWPGHFKGTVNGLATAWRYGRNVRQSRLIRLQHIARCGFPVWQRVVQHGLVITQYTPFSYSSCLSIDLFCNWIANRTRMR